MKVLWITQDCSLQDKEGSTSFISRYERAMVQHCAGQVELAVAFMADEAHREITVRDEITYYPVFADMRVGMISGEWETTRQELLRVIDAFQPDLIECFGTEWPYGAIAESTAVPVVIHILGFLNSYYLALDMVHGFSRAEFEKSTGGKRRLRAAFGRQEPPRVRPEDTDAAFERRVMRAAHYYMGRTQWDRRIARYYSPGSRYYEIAELTKPDIYSAPERWRYHQGKKLQLFSLSSCDDRKGNEIILHAAKILMDVVGLDFEWIVAGNPAWFPGFEQKTGIRCEDVHIRLIGMIDSRQIVEEMCRADFSIHPSIMDNSPHAVCEAQLIGCPVIASNVGGVPQLIEDGVTGWLYPYNEPHTLAFLISDLCSDEMQLTKVSEQEVKVSHRRHDPEKIAGDMLRAYKDILQCQQ